MTKPEDIEARVHRLICIQLGIDADKIKREDSFVADYGADSLDTIELVMAVEDEFAIEVPDEAAEKIRTVGDAIDYIGRRVKD